MSSFITDLLNAILHAISSVIEKIAAQFDSLFHRFKRKEKKESSNEIPDKWKKEKQRKASKKTSARAKEKVELDKAPRTVYHATWLRSAKRWLCALMLFLNFIVSQFIFVAAQNPFLAFFFFANCFLLIDYLWKTRKVE